MARLALSIGFLGELAKLERRQQARVAQLADIFRQQTVAELGKQKGVHLESHTNAADSRARTVRIDENHRGVLIDAGDNETFIFSHIGTHDDTDRWMANNKFSVNQFTGAIEIRNTVALTEAIDALGQQPPSPVDQFKERRDRDFINLGVDEDLIPTIRACSTDDQLQGLLGVMPPVQAEAVLMLLGDEPVDVLYKALAGGINPEEIDTEDLVAALEAPASLDQFRVFADENEEQLTSMLSQPLSRWRLYLHHTQQDLAYRDAYNGPTRVTGGAGTGKTIVAIHRAAHLASMVEPSRSKPILFTTFTRNLAEVIEHELRQLGGSELLDKVEVLNVDRLAYRVVADAEGSRPYPIDSADSDRLWQEAVDRAGVDHSPEFVANEWEQVVLAQNCQSRTDYFQARRAGRGIRLDRRQRASVWKAIEGYNQALVERDQRSYLQIAAAAAGHLDGRTTEPYQHVIVDESQDLHETQWRMLRAAVAPGPNDLFIVGDTHQRIYDRRASLAQVGINIVGRSKKLRINYRTTHEILRWAMTLLGEEDIEGGSDIEDDTQNIASYHSVLHGPSPKMHAVSSKSAQLDGLLEQIHKWIDNGIRPAEIAIAARVTPSLNGLESSLKSAGIECVMMDKTKTKAEGVRLGTMHRMKGLEFRAVAVVDVNDDLLPFHLDLTPKSADEVQHRVDLMRERCLLYVACTRARDQLWVGASAKPSRFIEPML